METLVQKDLSKNNQIHQKFDFKSGMFDIPAEYSYARKILQSFFNEATQLHHKNRRSPVLTFCVSCRVFLFFFYKAVNQPDTKKKGRKNPALRKNWYAVIKVGKLEHAFPWRWVCKEPLWRKQAHCEQIHGRVLIYSQNKLIHICLYGPPKKNPNSVCDPGSYIYVVFFYIYTYIYILNWIKFLFLSISPTLAPGDICFAITLRYCVTHLAAVVCVDSDRLSSLCHSFSLKWWRAPHPQPFLMASWRAPSGIGAPVWVIAAYLATSCPSLLCSPAQEMEPGVETCLSACVSP